MKMLKLALLAIVSSLVSLHAAPTCTEPDNASLETRFKNINHGLDYRTLFFTSGWDENTMEGDFNRLVVQGMNYAFAACPNTFLKGEFPLMLRSACPWFLIKRNDPERFPKQLYDADSKCTKCINSNGVQKCERVYQQIKTLKKSGCSNGVYQYEEQTEAITVAFTCAQPREVENSVPATAPPADDGPETM